MYDSNWLKHTDCILKDDQIFILSFLLNIFYLHAALDINTLLHTEDKITFLRPVFQIKRSKLL